VLREVFRDAGRFEIGEMPAHTQNDIIPISVEEAGWIVARIREMAGTDEQRAHALGLRLKRSDKAGQGTAGAERVYVFGGTQWRRTALDEQAGLDVLCHAGLGEVGA
jgi:hypothetical protein